MPNIYGDGDNEWTRRRRSRVTLEAEHKAECREGTYAGSLHELGDVRRCRHGVIQWWYTYSGGVHWWNDLDFLDSPILSIRAWWALRVEERQKISD